MVLLLLSMFFKGLGLKRRLNSLSLLLFSDVIHSFNNYSASCTASFFVVFYEPGSIAAMNLPLRRTLVHFINIEHRDTSSLITKNQKVLTGKI